MINDHGEGAMHRRGNLVGTRPRQHRDIEVQATAQRTVGGRGSVAVMRRFAGVATVALALALTGCTGSSGGSTGATDNTESPVTQPTASGCAAFATFMSDLETSGPQDQQQLVADAQAVQQGASGRLLTDATNLAAYVGSSAWTSEGNVNSAQVQRVQADCP